MQTRRRIISEDRDTTVTRIHNTRSKKTNSANEIENSDPIPIDLFIEILSRLPTKSIAACRFVSKHWASTLRRPDFTEAFLTRSSSRPQLLFACPVNGGFVFLSSPQPQNPGENSSHVVASSLNRFSFDGECEIAGTVHDLVCGLDKRFSKAGKKENALVICNPSTGIGVKSFLGYDPIDKQFKVLAMSSLNSGWKSVFDEHQILTLGSGKKKKKPSWRMIECCVPHYSVDKGICINGVLSYLAGVEKYKSLSMVVCFDVKSEKFKFVTLVEEASFAKVCRDAMVDYNGRLGLFVSQDIGRLNGNGGGSFELWVLEDAEKHEWSKHKYELPASWQSTLRTTCLRFVGITRTNEVVLLSYYRNVLVRGRVPLCVFYYDLERNTITKVQIRGMRAFNSQLVYSFVDYVEDVKLMQDF